MNDDRVTSTYESPRLRVVGSVHELTQGGLGKTSDGVLFRTVNGS